MIPTRNKKYLFFSYKGGGSFTDEKELFDELEILASLFPHPHPNIVNLVGGSTFDDGKECRIEQSRMEKGILGQEWNEMKIEQIRI